MKLPLVFVFCLFVFSHWGNASPVKYDNEDGEDTGVVANLLKLFDEVPVLKSMIEKSGLSFDEIKLLFGEQNLIGQLVNNIYKLSPVAGEIIDDAAKTNVEIRVVLAIARGKTPNLFDIFKLATSKQENMWTSIDNAASQNEHAQYILQKMKEPNPDIPNIWNMLTGKHLETDGIVDNDKYAIASSTKKKNRHLYEMSKFIEANWRPLEKAFHVLANLPINFVKVLQYILGLDYSAFRFAIAPSTMMNGKKYMITDNKSKYTVVGQGQSTFDPDDDADIVNILNEIRVKYPAMHDTFVRTNGNTAVFSHWGNASPVKYDNEEGEDTGVVANLLKLFDEVPVLKSTIEKSGLSFDEIKLLFGEQNLIGQLVNNIYKLSPVAGEIIDDAAKTNVEIRVVLAIARGKTPNLFDIFKLATSKQENMWTSIDNAASQNEHAQYILQKMKEPNPDIPNIWNMLTGKHLETDGIVDNDKYAIASSTKKKNRHLYEMSKFIEANWRPLEKAFHVLANLPINFVKVLQYILGLDYSAFRFAIAPSTMMNGKKYMITDNKSKYTVVGQGQSTFDPDDDADIVNILNEIRVKYPAMHDTFVRTNGNTAARTAVLHLVTETIEILNRLIG